MFISIGIYIDSSTVYFALFQQTHVANVSVLCPCCVLALDVDAIGNQSILRMAGKLAEVPASLLAPATEVAMSKFVEKASDPKFNDLVTKNQRESCFTLSRLVPLSGYLSGTLGTIEKAISGTYAKKSISPLHNQSLLWQK